MKTYQWLIDEASIYHLVVTVTVVSVLERIMYCFMNWQEKDQCFVSNGKTPLVQMANMATSPAARAIRDLANILTSAKIGTHRVPIEDFVAGHYMCRLSDVRGFCLIP